MTAANQQIVSSFEELEMSPDEIAAEQDLELTSVKAILMQFSSLYRKQCKKDVEACFTDEEEVMARQVIANIARYSDDERIKLKAAVYIRNDKRGRLDVVSQMNGLNINVITFNEQLKKAKAAIERSKNSGVIDINSGNKELVENSCVE